MSNNSKLFIVAIISFSLGVMATVVFKKTETEVKTNTSNSTQKIRKPFFLKVKESGQKVIKVFTPTQNNVEVSNPLEKSEITSQADFFKLTNQVEKFHERLWKEVDKKFKRIQEYPTDPRELRNLQMVRNSVDAKFQAKELWYKASIEDEKTQTKIHLFFNYSSCSSKPSKSSARLLDICYQINFFVKHNTWENSSVSASVLNYQYLNDVPYIQLDLSRFEKFSKASDAIAALIPTPEEQMSIQYLKLVNGKMIWENGEEIKWQLSSENEFRKTIKLMEASDPPPEDSTDQ